MEQNLDIDEENQMLLWKIPAEQLDRDRLSLQMLEYNQVPGTLSFDYYYVDDAVCFRYYYAKWQLIEKYFQNTEADYETVYMLCQEILKIILEGENYLLKMEGYLLCPEWIFWNRFEKKVRVCYLPGRKKEEKSDFKKLVEYLMEHINHKDKRAVNFMYSLYERLVADMYTSEELWSFLQEIADETQSRKRENTTDQGKRALGKKQNSCEKEKAEIEKKGETIQEDSVPVRVRFQPVISFWEKHSIQNQLLQMITEYSFPVTECAFTIGNHEECDLYLPIDKISEQHAELCYKDQVLYLMDKESEHGCSVNAKKISAYEKVPCCDNDIVSFADISFRIRISKM